MYLSVGFGLKQIVHLIDFSKLSYVHFLQVHFAELSASLQLII